ncbi:MAG: hypothetical protein ACOC6C_01725 [Verrucomicrobiota bacterium]
MNVPVPDSGELGNCLGNVADLEFITKGGFKVVFKGTVNGETEAIKAMFLPGDSKGVEPELTAQFVARVKRNAMSDAIERFMQLAEMI